MGNNESLPPPPPPTGPPNLPPVLPPTAPPAPPAYQPPPPPSYNPPTESFPPTEQFPPTTQFPATEFPPTTQFPGGPPGGFPPDGTTAFEQPAEPPKKKTGLMIAGGLVAVGVVIGAIVLLTGGDDDKVVAPATTVSISIPDLSIPDFTVPEITIPDFTVPEITIPEITVPESTEPPVTEPDPSTTVVSGADPITDDLGVFTLVLPPGLAVDSTPITTQDDFVLPSIAGAVDLDGFYNDDVTPGMTALVVREDVGSTPSEVLAFLDPGDEVCARREQIDAHPTALGSAILLKLDECADGTAAKVILVIAIEGSTSIAAHYVQGPGSSTDLLPEAQTVFESIRLL